MLTHALNLADPHRRFAFSRLTIIGMFRRFAAQDGRRRGASGSPVCDILSPSGGADIPKDSGVVEE